MPSTPWITNPVAFALFHAKGGQRGFLLISSIVLAVLLLAAGGTAQLSGDSWRGTLANWAVGLFVLQNAALSLGAVSALAGIVRADIASGMHDSLRLSRVTGSAVMLGYLAGSATQPLAVYLPCMLVGTACSFASHGHPALYLAGSAILLVLCTLLGAFSLLISLVVRQPAVPTLACILGVPVLYGLSFVVPPLAVLMGPLLGGINFGTRRSDLEPALIFSVLTQLVLATLLLLAASRKFVEPDRPAFRTDLGLVLLGLWSAAAVLAMLMPDTFGMNTTWPPSPRVLEPHHFAGTLIPALLVLTVPLFAAAARSARSWRSRRQGRPDPHSPLAYLVTTLTAVAVALLPLMLVPRLKTLPTSEVLLLSALCVLGYAWLFANFARRALAASPRFGLLLSVVLALAVLIVPLLLEWLLMLAGNFTYDFDRLGPRLAQFSPAFILGYLWMETRTAPIPTSLHLGAYTLPALALVSQLVFRLPPASKPSPTAPPPSPQP